jgi:signal peptidase I
VGKVVLGRGHLSRGRFIAYVIILAVALILLYFIYVRHVQPFRVPTASMLPTLQPNDFIFTMQQDRYERGDIVVLKDPLNPNQRLVKRIVAVGGDTVGVHFHALILNGAYASEPYTNELTINYTVWPPLEVPPEEFFVLGDNRNESEDSSSSAPDGSGPLWPSRTVAKDMIVGKVVYIYLPFGRVGPVRHFPLENALAAGDVTPLASAR